MHKGWLGLRIPLYAETKTENPVFIIHHTRSHTLGPLCLSLLVISSNSSTDHLLYHTPLPLYTTTTLHHTLAHPRLTPYDDHFNQSTINTRHSFPTQTRSFTIDQHYRFTLGSSLR
jgi:hypothetical protein